MSDGSNPLALAAALTRHTEQLCIGLEHGIVDICGLVTPVTAELLRWRFAEEACQARSFNFHPGQRQAILNVIVAHEVLGSPNLKDLYTQVCADALLEGTRLADVAQGKHGHPKYCLKMATGNGKTWVLQALLVWQLLNKTAALDEGRDDPRFTRRFLIVAPGLIVYERLLDAFLGKENEDKSRDFSSSDIASYAELFTPPARRERIAQFVRGNVCQKQEIGLKATGNGMIAITNWHLLSEAEEEVEQDETEWVDTPGMVADAARVAYHVQRKLKAAITWCERINSLEPALRCERQWRYALVGEALFHDWKKQGARLAELLALSAARPPTGGKQGRLDV